MRGLRGTITGVTLTAALLLFAPCSGAVEEHCTGNGPTARCVVPGRGVGSYDARQMRIDAPLVRLHARLDRRAGIVQAWRTIRGSAAHLIDARFGPGLRALCRGVGGSSLTSDSKGVVTVRAPGGRVVTWNSKTNELAASLAGSTIHTTSPQPYLTHRSGASVDFTARDITLSLPSATASVAYDIDSRTTTATRGSLQVSVGLEDERVRVARDGITVYESGATRRSSRRVNRSTVKAGAGRAAAVRGCVPHWRGWTDCSTGGSYSNAAKLTASGGAMSFIDRRRALSANVHLRDGSGQVWSDVGYTLFDGRSYLECSAQRGRAMLRPPTKGGVTFSPNVTGDAIQMPGVTGTLSWGDIRLSPDGSARLAERYRQDELGHHDSLWMDLAPDGAATVRFAPMDSYALHAVGTWQPTTNAIHLTSYQPETGMKPRIDATLNVTTGELVVLDGGVEVYRTS